MPIRFFCEHCRQMLKIGTSKMGSTVDCPRCNKAVIVPAQSVPQAEQLYQLLKSKQSPKAPTPSTGENLEDTVSEPTEPESALRELEGSVSDADLNQWLDELWTTQPKEQQESVSITLPFPVSDTNSIVSEVALSAMQKRFKLAVTLLYVAATIAFVIGIVFGIFIRGLYAPSIPSRYSIDVTSEAHEVMGTLYYLNEHGERRADVDAVVICLPKDKSPPTPLSCKGLRPGDVADNDTIQRIREMEGMYERTDAAGSFTLNFREKVQYLVILISAHQKRSGSLMKPSVQQELRRYFHNPELFGEHCFSVNEYEWSKHSLQHTFVSGE